MSKRYSLEDWLRRIEQGNEYEGKVVKEWQRLAEGWRKAQRRVRKQSGRSGRIYLFIDATDVGKKDQDDIQKGKPPSEESGDSQLLLAVVEFKDSNWDKMTDMNLRCNVRRHARQVLAYVEALFEELGEFRFLDRETAGICPMIEYSRRPGDSDRAEMVEAMLAEECIAVAWNDGSSD